MSGGLVSADPEDHAPPMSRDLDETLTEALEFTGAFTPEAFPWLTQHLDPLWIEEALLATGTATIRRRRLPAERTVWLMLGMALLRDLPITRGCEAARGCVAGWLERGHRAIARALCGAGVGSRADAVRNRLRSPTHQDGPHDPLASDAGGTAAITMMPLRPARTAQHVLAVSQPLGPQLGPQNRPDREPRAGEPRDWSL